MEPNQVDTTKKEEKQEEKLEEKPEEIEPLVSKDEVTVSPIETAAA